MRKLIKSSRKSLQKIIHPVRFWPVFRRVYQASPRGFPPKSHLLPGQAASRGSALGRRERRFSAGIGGKPAVQRRDGGSVGSAPGQGESLRFSAGTEGAAAQRRDRGKASGSAPGQREAAFARLQATCLGRLPLGQPPKSAFSAALISSFFWVGSPSFSLNPRNLGILNLDQGRKKERAPPRLLIKRKDF